MILAPSHSFEPFPPVPDHYDMLKTLLAMELKTSPEEADMLIRQCEVDGKVDYDQILARFRG